MTCCRSFGTFQEKPAPVVLRFDADAASDAASFLFHPDQTVENLSDGAVRIRFEAGSFDEMCWHLVTWGETVTVEKPARLRRRLARMCAALAEYHGDE
ncbi:MAG: WYL domain-containing protein [Rhodospirillaceae bacterium]|nr:WYL domain-containing protein [Rhodospirillaceae bacterium]